jgi:hypothetical protein
MLTVINKVDRTSSIPFDSITIESVQGDPLGKFTFTLEDPGSQIQLASQQEVIVWDENVRLSPSIVVPAAFTDVYLTDATSTMSNYTSTNNPLGGVATWTQNVQTGGGTTALATYAASAASSTISTANKLYATEGSPTTVNALTTCNNSTGWGELVSQGSGASWPALGAIGNPSGKGYFLDVNTLDGLSIAAGNWSGNRRVSANAAGTITADLVTRVYRYRPSTTTYTLIVSWTLTAQSWTTTINTVALPATAGSSIAFAAGDRLYIDDWAHITANTSSAGQQVRFNRQSATANVGEVNTRVSSPGYGVPVVNGNITASGGTFALLLLNNWLARYISITVTQTTSDFGGLCFNVVNASNFYEVSVQDDSSSTPSIVQIYKTVAGIRSALGSPASISFPRGTSHSITVSTSDNGSGATIIVVSFDGVQVRMHTDSSSPLAIGQVGLRNDTGSSIYTGLWAASNDIPTLVQSVPAHNYLNNNDFVVGSGGWTTTGSIGTLTFPAQGTYPPGAKCTISVSNAAIGNKQAYQDIPHGYCIVGQSYCFSAYMQITTAFVNADTFLQFLCLDVSGSTLSTAKATFTALTSGYTRVSVTGIAQADTATIRVSIGIETTVAGTNSGVVAWTGLQFEPIWFPFLYTYPTSICDFLQSDSITLPDGTATRFSRIFTGFITHRKVTYGGTTRYYEVTAVGVDGLLENVTLVNATYNSTTDQSIITGIVNSLFPLYLFANSSILMTNSPLALAYHNVPICVAGRSIDSIQYADATLREIINSLANQTGFLAGVDQYYNVYYYPPFYNSAPYGFSDTPDNITTFPYYDYEIEYDGTQLQNNIRVAGGTYEVQITENFTAGDGTHSQYIVSGNKTAGFYLTYPSEGTLEIPQVTFGGTLQTTAIDTGVGFGTSQTLIQYDNTHIGIATAINAGTSISVTYTYKALAYVNVLSPDSIAKYGRSFYGKINDSNLASNASATVRGEAELEAYSDDRITMSFKTWKLLSPGQIIEFTSSLDGLSKAHFIVQKVTVRDLGYDMSLGHRINEYEIHTGIYIDDFVDYFRNTQKAVNRASHDPLAAIQQTNLLQMDRISFTDSLSIHT